MKIRLPDDKTSKYLLHGVEYTVFAIYLEEPIQIMVQVDSLPAAPHSVLLNNVDIVDNRLSKYWLFGKSVPKTDSSMGRPEILAFPEWIDDVYFYQDIIDSNNRASEVWREYKEKMEFEFAPSNLDKVAINLPDGWLQCVNCSDAWQSDSIDEVVSCPSCLTIQRRKQN